jgi:hypothetical protein
MKSLLTGARITAMALAVILTFAFATSAHAIEIEKAGKATIPVELKYRGIYKSKPLFEVVIGNTEDREYTITVKDAEGIMLYREKVRGAQISKYFVMNEEVENQSLEFVISCRKTNETVVYKVNSGTRVVQDIAISKVK